MPEMEMFSHSTPLIPRGSLQVACEKIGDHLGSGIISGRVQKSAYQREAETNANVNKC